MEMRDGLDFERKIYVKQQTAWLLRQELKEGEARRSRSPSARPPTPISLPRSASRSRAAFLRNSPCITDSRSESSPNQISLFATSICCSRWPRHNTLTISLTVTTLNTKLARILEPRAPRPDLRLKRSRELSAAGLNAGVICAPVLPGITDSPAALDKLVRATKEAGGKYISANTLFPEAVLGEYFSAVSGEGVSRISLPTIANATPIAPSSARHTASGCLT